MPKHIWDRAAADTRTRAAIDVFFQALATDDSAAATQRLATDAACTFHVNHPDVARSGDVRGQMRIAAHFAELRTVWSVVRCDRQPARINDGSGRVQLSFAVCHLPSGLIHEGTGRLTLQVDAAGRICRLELIHDTAGLLAFLRYAATLDTKPSPITNTNWQRQAARLARGVAARALLAGRALPTQITDSAYVMSWRTGWRVSNHDSRHPASTESLLKALGKLVLAPKHRLRRR